jgi:adenylyltransferase/sulfurtransferase
MCQVLGKQATITGVAIDRYHRQRLLPQIGEAGQARLARAVALIVGCGALGSTIAEQLARAGVGLIRIADRDIVELTNLQRQVLFDESDAREGLPKVVAAARRIGAINSNITVEPLLIDVDATNVASLITIDDRQSRIGCQTVDVILDGTDNVATRYLLNDVSAKHSIPWIYGACVGTEGRVMTIRPGVTPCLRCVFPTPPDPRELPTCETAGVLGPVACVVGSLQAVAAIKLLSGQREAVAAEMLTLELWSNRLRSVSLVDAKRDDCPTCARRHFEFLDSAVRDATVRLCGRDAVQVRAADSDARQSLEQLAARLGAAGKVELTPYLVRCALHEPGISVTAFADGRVIVKGTSDPARARSIVARVVGA